MKSGVPEGKGVQEGSHHSKTAEKLKKTIRFSFKKVTENLNDNFNGLIRDGKLKQVYFYLNIMKVSWERAHPLRIHEFLFLIIIKNYKIEKYKNM